MTWFDGILTCHGLLKRRILRFTRWLALLTAVLAATPALADLPVVTITGGGDTYLAGATVNLTAMATDTEDNNTTLTASIAWSSNLDRPYTETASIAFNFDGSLSSNLDAAGKERSQLSFKCPIVTCNDNVWTFSR